MYDQSDKVETNQTLYQQCHCFTFIEAKLDKSHVLDDSFQLDILWNCFINNIAIIVFNWAPSM